MIANKRLLSKDEKNYFADLSNKFGITCILVDDEGVEFKEDEFQNFINPNESSEVGLDKLLELNRITKKIHERLKFNFIINLSKIKNGVEVALEFFE